MDYDMENHTDATNEQWGVWDRGNWGNGEPT